MKKIFLLLILFSISVIAQTHRFIYEYSYKMDSLAEEKRTVNMTLDVNPDHVKFYNYDFVVNDSSNITKGQRNVLWDDTPAIIRMKGTNTNSSYIMLQNMFVIDTEDKMQWRLLNDTKKIGEYSLQKATAKFGGRNWTAWFTKDIAVNEGPYKFRGLPGMIFEIYDDKDNFKFSLLKSYKLAKTYETLSILENLGGQKPVKINEKQLKKMMLDHFDNPLREFAEQYKNNTDPSARFMVMGVEIKSPDQIKELSDNLRNFLRKNNNPLELDKAIHYPSK